MDCGWVSYDVESQNCFLFETCPEIEENDQYVSGQSECEYSILSKFF